MYNLQARQKHPQCFLEFFISAFQRIFTNYSLFQPRSDMALNTKQGDKDSIAAVAATSYYFCSDEIASPAFFPFEFLQRDLQHVQTEWHLSRLCFGIFGALQLLNWLSVLNFLFQGPDDAEMVDLQEHPHPRHQHHLPYCAYLEVKKSTYLTN